MSTHTHRGGYSRLYPLPGSKQKRRESLLLTTGNGFHSTDKIKAFVL
ncbi:MAG: hypothetical protein LBU57_07435 [Dysgonamonadaceae bacterium]|nr:hypothetical protein [Dysgonamonadaceae bacterium]